MKAICFVPVLALLGVFPGADAVTIILDGVVDPDSFELTGSMGFSGSYCDNAYLEHVDGPGFTYMGTADRVWCDGNPNGYPNDHLTGNSAVGSVCSLDLGSVDIQSVEVGKVWSWVDVDVPSTSCVWAVREAEIYARSVDVDGFRIGSVGNTIELTPANEPLPQTDVTLPAVVSASFNVDDGKGTLVFSEGVEYVGNSFDFVDKCHVHHQIRGVVGSVVTMDLRHCADSVVDNPVFSYFLGPSFRDLAGNQIAVERVFGPYAHPDSEYFDDIPITLTRISLNPCTPPDSGDWIVREPCTLDSDTRVPAGVIIRAPATLTIPSGVTLDVDFANHGLLIKDGAGLLIVQGGGMKSLPDQASVPNATTEVQFAVGSIDPACANTDECFIPSEVTVDVGGEVTWTNVDNVFHTIAAGDLSEDPSMIGTDYPNGFGDVGTLIQPGETFTHKFEVEGTYPYVCTVHPWMVGTVVVIG